MLLAVDAVLFLPLWVLAGSRDLSLRHNAPQTCPKPIRAAAQMLVAAALGFASAAPADVRFVAVHGTGTPLGDPIEVGALGAALAGKDRDSDAGNLAPTLGSVKACYGHTEGAAGVTGAPPQTHTNSHVATSPVPRKAAVAV